MWTSSAPTAPIRAVLFDADGVVQIPRPSWLASLAALCGIPDRTDEFLADVFAAEKPCLAGRGDFEPALAAVLRKWRSSVALEDALQIWTEIEPSADTLGVVRALRSAGIAVALTTNQQAHRANYMANGLGYAEHFDHLLYSCELGHAKPSAAFFSSALVRIATEPERTLFIDDDEANVAAARDGGLHAEVYHLSEGVGRLHEVLKRHGLHIA